MDLAVLVQQERTAGPEVGHAPRELGEEVPLLDGVMDAELGAEVEAALDEAAGGEPVQLFLLVVRAGAVELAPGETEVVVLVTLYHIDQYHVSLLYYRYLLVIENDNRIGCILTNCSICSASLLYALNSLRESLVPCFSSFSPSSFCFSALPLPLLSTDGLRLRLKTLSIAVRTVQG